MTSIILSDISTLQYLVIFTSIVYEIFSGLPIIESSSLQPTSVAPTIPSTERGSSDIYVYLNCLYLTIELSLYKHVNLVNDVLSY